MQLAVGKKSFPTSVGKVPSVSEADGADNISVLVKAMDKIHNHSLSENAKQLRRDMTKEERHLWFDFLMNYQPRFRKQAIVGNYIIDFYCVKAKLAIELDGSQHYEADEIAYDKKRTEDLEACGIKVIRFQNTDVMQVFEGVCDKIDQCVKERIK